MAAGVNAEAFNPEAYDVEIQRTAALRVVLPAVDTCARLILGMKWRFFIAKKASSFIVSDHPFCMINRRDPEIPSGLGSKHIQVSLPLTPCWLLRLSAEFRNQLKGFRRSGKSRSEAPARPDERSSQDGPRPSDRLFLVFRVTQCKSFPM